ncbi:MAG TPA: branched-chain amino acid ABC transporter substrate-binding protein [Proteobacteria bacterium]|nr:branched-chain amino acid ABC transporter substrate-binding protein [Pseudomonadota bacterium]
MKKIFSRLGTGLLLLLFCGSVQAEKTIKIGGLFDITGGTGSVGTPYAQGVRDYVRYLNEEQGGLNGIPLELLDVDYAYKISQALAAYKNFKNSDVVAIQGWGTGDTEAMAPLINKDRIPYFSASYSEHLCNPALTPYNFSVGVTYADQARAVLSFIRENWADESRPPRVAFIYNDTGFGRSPFFTVRYQGHLFPGAEDYARALGIEIVARTIIDLRSLEVSPQLLGLKKADPDFILVQQTSEMATILKDAEKLKLRSRFFALNWAMSREILAQAGAAAENCYWVNPFCVWEDSGPGVSQAKMVSLKYHPGKIQPVNYFQGFVAMQVMVEGLRRIKGEVTGPKLKEALETMQEFETGGLTMPISFSPVSHKGTMGMRLYQVRNGRFVLVEALRLERRPL